MSNQTKDLVFIISGGRTGTQFLGDRLSMAIGDSFSIHQPDVLPTSPKRVGGRIKTFGIWNMIFGKVIGRAGVRSIGQRLISGRINRSTAIDRLRKLRSNYHYSVDESLFIESNLQWLYACSELVEIWPHARIIVVVRDPRTWIRSWLNKGIRWRPYDPVRLLPPGRITPKEARDIEWTDQWQSFDTFGRLAWEWRFIYSRLDEHVGKNPNARLFRFEDIFDSNNSDAMRKLVEFAATHESRRYPFHIDPSFTAKVQNASVGNAPDWHNWGSDQARLVDQLCGSLMRKYGYGTEPEWRRMLDSNQ